MITKKLLFILLLSTFILGLSFSSFAQQELKQADKHFKQFEYTLALEAYKKILEDTQPDATIIQRIADIYRLMNNSKEAEFWYAQATGLNDADPSAFYFYAEAAKRNGNYAMAKQMFNEYGKRVPDKIDLANHMAASCDSAILWIKQPQSYDIKKSSAISSESVDFSPTPMPGGVLFSSDKPVVNGSNKEQLHRFRWTGNGYVQLYFSYMAADSTLGNPEPLPQSINTSFHNGAASFLEKENTLFFTRTNHGKRSAKTGNTDPTSWVGLGLGKNVTIRLEIFMAELKGDKWVNIRPFKYNKASQYSVGHPAVTPDGQLLYFVSDMEGGFGETDIYYCERQKDGSWGKPVNAGNTINTSGRESFPSIGADGNLYFSSDRHTGLGGLDIFKAEGDRSTWKSVVNLKYPVNSPSDDFGAMVDTSGVRGMLSSGRNSDNGSDNIYTFKRIRVPCSLVGVTIERITVKGTTKKKIVPVEQVFLQMFEEENGVLKEIFSDAQGKFKFEVKAGLNYTIRGSKKGYLTQTVNVVPQCIFNTDSVKVEMVFNRDTPNKPIVLENIFYDLDKHEIRPDAALELDKLVQTLKDNPTIRIELSSHTDSRNTQRYNDTLSRLRAQAAVDYLISKGIERNRLVAKGYGESQLLNKCADGVTCSEEQHQLNRRTEFKIIK
ncbi:OmpA family protein [Pontibacter vulgaris]|uniref:OmpA family protein n=1 Tax=Pontibacter vulgaris TaxID=2905679 RepID=UPI001FA6F63D|nr:OmpA family protein [Pontibacter vulgaris]